MALTILKFGGSSLSGPERLRRAAEEIAAEHRAGKRVAAVLSARGDLTDRLLAGAAAICPEPPARELDLLLSVGEQIAVSHMAFQLAVLGCPCTALTGWQAGIRTDRQFGGARIETVTGERVRSALDAGRIVLVAGFQGVSGDGEITTLGRGGSDTTAVALAAFLGADECRICTDVDGVFTADPNLLPEARRLETVSYGDMLEMAERGAKVLHSRCVELAREHGLRFRVCAASGSGRGGTLIGPEDDRQFCGTAVLRRGDTSEVSLIGRGCAEKEAAERASALLGGLAPASRRERSITFTVPAARAAETAAILHRAFLSEAS